MAYNYRDDAILGPVLGYWMGKRGYRSMPRKRDIDPIEISPQVLPYLQIIEAINGGARFRYRLVGTALVEAYGKDFSGCIADELFSDSRLDFVQGIYRTVCETKAPLFSRNKYYTPRNAELFSMRVYMPLSENDAEVHHILCAMRFDYGTVFDNRSWGLETTMEPEWHYTEAIDLGGRSLAVAN